LRMKLIRDVCTSYSENTLSIPLRMKHGWTSWEILNFQSTTFNSFEDETNWKSSFVRDKTDFQFLWGWNKLVRMSNEEMTRTLRLSIPLRMKLNATQTAFCSLHFQTFNSFEDETGRILMISWLPQRTAFNSFEDETIRKACEELGYVCIFQFLWGWNRNQ